MAHGSFTRKHIGSSFTKINSAERRLSLKRRCFSFLITIMVKGTPHMLKLMKKMRRVWNQNRQNSQEQMRKDKYLIFSGSEENFVKNGAWVLRESIYLFHGRTNPVHHFSVDDLNNMNVEPLPYNREGFLDFYQGSWKGRAVLVCMPFVGGDKTEILRDIVVATQMVAHNNSRKIIGYCLETDNPVLVYEWLLADTLHDRIFVGNESQHKGVLEWKDRLRIAWEISHVVAYLHTAFPRPIIHRNLTPLKVYLDQNNAAILRDFSLSISIPEGEKFVKDVSVAGTMGFLDPEYCLSGMVAQSTDVYSFGVLLLVLLTGEKAYWIEDHEGTNLSDWVKSVIKTQCIDEIIDPSITRNGLSAFEDLQLRSSIQLALWCVENLGDNRPTMVEVATELKNMIRSPESIPTISSFNV